MADLRFEKDGIKIPSINIAPVSKLINITQKYDNIGLIRPTSSHMGTFDIIEDSTITTMQSALDKFNTLWDFDDYDSVNHILTWGNSTISSPSSNSCYFKYNDNSYDYYSSTNHNNNTESSTFFIKTDRCIILVGTYYCVFIGYATNAETNEQVKCSGHISTDGSLNHHFYLDSGESISIDSFPSNSSVSDNSDFFYYGSIISSSHYIIDKLANATILGRRNVTGEYLIGTTPLYLVSRFAIIDTILSSQETSNYMSTELINKLAQTPIDSESIIDEFKTDVADIRPMFYYNAYLNYNYNVSNTAIKTLTANNCNFVGHNAFYNNFNLEQVNLGANLDSGSIVINDYAFYGCNHLHTVNIPNNVSLSLGQNVFNNCTTLTNINLNHLTIVGSYCFRNSSITELNTPNLVRCNAAAFMSCEQLVSVNLPNVTYADSSSFEDCIRLEQINLPKATTLGSYCFKNTAATTLNLPNVTSISSYSIFANMQNLITIDLPNVAGGVGPQCFLNCSNLTSLSLPNVTIISNYSFGNCSNLLELDLPLVTSVGGTGSAFFGCSNITTINLPNLSNRTLAGDLFANCSNLTTLNIPNNYINRVNANTFRYCSNFANFDFTNVDNIGSLAFNFSGLTSVTLPKMTSAPADGAFMSCPNLVSVDLPKVTTILSNTFRNCVNLVSVNLPLVTNVQAYAFRSCQSLNNFVLSNVTTLNASVFQLCSNLTSYDFSSTTTTTIKSNCFANSGLTSITIPSKITSMQDGIFSYCEDLTDVTLSGGSITSNLFIGCKKLSHLKLTKSSVVALGYMNALYNTKLLAGGGIVVVPDNLVSNYKSAANWSKLASNQIVGESDEPNITVIDHPNLLENIEWESGTINNQGQPANSSYYIRSTEFLFVEAGTYHFYFRRYDNSSLQVQVFIYDYDGSTYTFNRNTSMAVTPRDITFDADCYVKFVFYNNSNNLVPTDLLIGYMSEDYTYPWDILTNNE